jgi:spore coat polysaccharide biosynthesis protein SpsF
LTLGTAQLGLDYGIANNSGMPLLNEAVGIVQYAIDHGLTHIDSARAYGEAEKRVGKALSNGYAERVNVITKLDPLADTSITDSAFCLRKAVDASIFQSCRELGAESIQTLLLHRWEHRYLRDGEVWKRLLQLKYDGVISTLGVSVQTPEEAIQALADPEIGHIQMPFNILDWRWKRNGIDKAAFLRDEVVIHARSTLLQGLLATNDVIKMPNTSNELSLKLNRKLDDLVQAFQRENRKDLCFAYIRAQTWIDSLVIGVETLDQLKENIVLFQNSPLTLEECAVIENELQGAPVELLDPSKW